tara:strand:+ start:62 stop:652 length:591 start_codon:yes stop_codon:yes gene_type:complete
MNLSSEACLILKDPMKYLDILHGQKSVIDPTHIWHYKHGRTGLVAEEIFVKSLGEIRKWASQRGPLGEEKNLIHTSILNYSKRVCHRFGSVNKLNYHLKGLYGCELPKKFRDELHNLIFNGGLDQEQEEATTPPSEPTVSVETKEVNIGGLKFTLSTGSSLTIGELSTESFNLQGMKSIKIDKVSEGRLFGVSLEV